MSNSKRVLSLDSLRGFAILTMVLSGVIPYGLLPSWMYHAQIPPPDHNFIPTLPGLTWVDLVFPLFLFALGAAIPLALGKKLEKNTSYTKLFFQIIERTFLLVFFSIFLKHVRPHSLNPVPENIDWLIGLVGFILMFMIFARFPFNMPKKYHLIIKISGWVLSIILLSVLTYPNDGHFSLYRSDIIILVLANVYFFGSLIWLVSQKNLLLRIAFLAIYLALRLAHNETGIANWIWDNIQVPWLFKVDYLKYLFIVIPGTIVGDFVVDWINERKENPNPVKSWNNKKLYLLAFFTLSFIPVLLIGMHARFSWQTGIIVFILGVIGLYLFNKPQNINEKLLTTLFNWTFFFLIVGIILEPFEGGIKKDPSTLAYYFITTGMSICILIAFIIFLDLLEKGKIFRILTENGQNPMIAYVGIANFIWPIFGIIGIDKWIESFTVSPWLGFLRGVFYTILLSIFVSIITRKKIYWKT